MNAPFQMSMLAGWRHGDTRDWLAVYRQAEGEAEAAASAVRAACDTFKAARTRDAQDAYAEADRAYDKARLRYQATCREIVTGVRSIAGIARELQLASQSSGRML